MTEVRYKIVFDGELMPGASTDTVKDNLARLFKSDRSKIDSLFGGRPVALKRDLDSVEADKYLAALQQAGARVRKEQDLAAALSLVDTQDEPDPESLGRMTCPKCGHEQTTSSQCEGCGIVIEKYLARQAQLAEAAAAARVAPAAAPAPSPYAPPQAQVGDLPEYGNLKVFGVQGRIGRLRYLGWYMALLLLAVPVLLLVTGLWAVFLPLGVVLGGLAAIALTVLSIFMGAQRLHDIGWSGWFQLLNLVPFVGGVLTLLMLVVPGNPGLNRYGPPPPPNSRAVKLLASTLILVPILGILAAIAIPAYQQYQTRSHSQTPASVVAPTTE